MACMHVRCVRGGGALALAAANHRSTGRALAHTRAAGWGGMRRWRRRLGSAGEREGRQPAVGGGRASRVSPLPAERGSCSPRCAANAPLTLTMRRTDGRTVPTDGADGRTDGADGRGRRTVPTDGRTGPTDGADGRGRRTDGADGRGRRTGPTDGADGPPPSGSRNRQARGAGGGERVGTSAARSSAAGGGGQACSRAVRAAPRARRVGPTP
jgi:hypothetical protein